MKNKITSLKGILRDSVRYSVWDSVSNSVRYSVWNSVRNSVSYSVWDSLRNIDNEE